MALEFDSKIDLKTVVILGAIVLSTVIGAIRIVDTQAAMQRSLLKSDVLNAEAHKAIGGRITSVERFQARQEGFNAALTQIAGEGND